MPKADLNTRNSTKQRRKASFGCFWCSTRFTEKKKVIRLARKTVYIRKTHRILICFTWLTCEAFAVEHQKLNQKTPYGVIWLNFWCSTYLSLFALSWLGFRFFLVCFFILIWFGSLVWKACFAFVCLLCFFFDCLGCFACLVCFALQWYALLDLVGFTWPGLACLPGLVWLGRLASWHALNFEQKIYKMYIFFMYK